MIEREIDDVELLAQVERIESAFVSAYSRAYADWVDRMILGRLDRPLRGEDIEELGDCNRELVCDQEI